MKASTLLGYAFVGLVALAAIWAYNRFSGKNVANLGVKAA